MAEKPLPQQPPNKNLTKTTESESKASENPAPLEVVIETPAKTREEAAKVQKDRQ